MLRKERTAHHPSVLIAPAYGLIPLQLADVLVVAGVVFAVRPVRTLRHEHTHTVELLASHLVRFFSRLWVRLLWPARYTSTVRLVCTAKRHTPNKQQQPLLISETGAAVLFCEFIAQ